MSKTFLAISAFLTAIIWSGAAPEKAWADPVVIVEGRHLLSDFNGDGVYHTYIIKGVGYSPYPIGRHVSDWGYPDPADPRPDNILDDKAILARDFFFLREMNANTIRIWKGDDTQEGTRFPVKMTITTLDTAERYGLKVIAGFWLPPEGYWEIIDGQKVFVRQVDYTSSAVQSDILTRFAAYVHKFKDHPAILFWALGNENNLYFSDDPAQAKAFASLVNLMALQAKTIEGPDYHPVALVNGDIENIEALEPLLPSVDIWGANVYRGPSFGNLFKEFKKKSKKPLWIAEFGIDAWHSDQADNPAIGGEDQQTQAEWDGILWDEIAGNPEVCIGGTVFEYSDEYWKPWEWIDGGIRNVSHDYFGTAPRDTVTPFDGQPDLYPASPDHFVNAEWFGIMGISKNPDSYGPDIMNPRLVYDVLSQKFALIDSGEGPPVDREPPTVPGNVRTEQVLPASAFLNWDASSDNVGVLGYKVFRDGVQVAVSTQPGYFSQGLTPGHTYYFQVSAYDAAGNESAKSLAVVVMTPKLCGPVSDLRAEVGDGQVMLRWTAPDGGAGVKAYQVLYAAAGQEPEDVKAYYFQVNDQMPDVATVILGLINDQKYWFRVRGYNKYGPGPLSEMITAVPVAPTPEPTPTPEPLPGSFVKWVDQLGVSVGRNGSLKQNAPAGWGNSGAASSPAVFGNGGMSFVATATNMSRICGLSYTNIDHHRDSVAFGILLDADGRIRVYEKGNLRGEFGTYAAGDIFMVQRFNNRVYYLRKKPGNATGVVFYKSLIPSYGAMLVDAALNTKGATIYNVSVF